MLALVRPGLALAGPVRVALLTAVLVAASAMVLLRAGLVMLVAPALLAACIAALPAAAARQGSHLDLAHGVVRIVTADHELAGLGSDCLAL
jgi:hypothetical protein